ncbi:CHAD domain-containing protein [Caballeronia sp. HLA56]
MHGRTDNASLHKARIASKKLRYLLEFFAPFSTLTVGER